MNIAKKLQFLSRLRLIGLLHSVDVWVMYFLNKLVKLKAKEVTT